MKRLITIIITLAMTSNVFLLQQVSAQAPKKISYQAVVRDGSNDLVTNSAVGMKISIIQGSASGNAVYEETQTPTTNDNGLVSIKIGEGSIVSGGLSTIDWANAPFFIKTETDPTGGTNYTISGTSELLSVPYALYAENGLPDGNDTETLRRTNSGWVADDKFTVDDNFIGLGSSASPIGSADLTVSEDVSDGAYGGMYINTNASNGEAKPFIGFATNGNSSTWIERDGTDNNDLEFFNNGTKLSVKRQEDAVHVHDSKVTSNPTGNSLSLLPIARGHVAADGTVKAATDNVTVNKFGNGGYDILIANEDLNEDDYSIIATINSNASVGDARSISIETSNFNSNSRYLIFLEDNSGNLTDANFSFIIYKDK